MRIYYKQNREGKDGTPFDMVGITECCFKHLRMDVDGAKNDRKTHRHNGFELHIPEKGYQEYEVGGLCRPVGAGEFLLIPPGVRHRPVSAVPGTEKFSVTFSCPELEQLTECVAGAAPARFYDNARFIGQEWSRHTLCSGRLIENAVFESVLAVLRLCGFPEQQLPPERETDDPRLETAKKYIADNADSHITLEEVAAYCCVSPRQLTRIFRKQGESSPAQYIIRQRVACIRELLENSGLSLREISERMEFKDPYYFNMFVKKYLGMPPGAYRKMHRRD